MQYDIANLLCKGCTAGATFTKNMMFILLNTTFSKAEHICSLLVNIKPIAGTLLKRVGLSLFLVHLVSAAMIQDVS
jgi:hypothetical protein